MSQQANKKCLPTLFKINDRVLLSTKLLSLEDASGPQKPYPKFGKPFEIIEKINDVTFRLNLLQPMIHKQIHNAFHSNLLQPFRSDAFKQSPLPMPAIGFADDTKK